jgi:magnesium chelatase accessory protein
MLSDVCMDARGRRRPVAIGRAAVNGAVPPTWPNRAASRIVESAGCRWHLQRMGQGRRVLLVHGTAASTHTWRHLMPMLAESHDVLAVDLPGHGFSGRLPGGSMALPALADALGELLDTVSFDPLIAVGHSAGAAVLVEMALDRLIEPAQIIGLNAALKPFDGRLQRLFSPLARIASGSRAIAGLLARRARDRRAVARLLEGTGSYLDDQGVELYRYLLSDPDRVAAVLVMMAQWDLHGLQARLGRLRVPLCLIAARGDLAVSPDEAVETARRVPGAEAILQQRGGHLAHEEFPGETFELIEAACARSCRGGPATAAGGEAGPDANRRAECRPSHNSGSVLGRGD